MARAAGVYEDDAVEVVFDAEWEGGSDLHGRATGQFGGMVALSDLLNLSKAQAVAATGQDSLLAEFEVTCVGRAIQAATSASHCAP